jgi:hypothetical protein
MNDFAATTIEWKRGAPTRRRKKDHCDWLCSILAAGDVRKLTWIENTRISSKRPPFLLRFATELNPLSLL